MRSRSKTDQDGAGQEVTLANSRHGPVGKALLTWLRMSGVRSGPLFRGVKRCEVADELLPGAISHGAGAMRPLDPAFLIDTRYILFAAGLAGHAAPAAVIQTMKRNLKGVEVGEGVYTALGAAAPTSPPHAASLPVRIEPFPHLVIAPIVQVLSRRQLF